jgi:hypothetical protein
MFAEPWLRAQQGEKSLLHRVNWPSLAQFMAGLAPFIVLTWVLNYARYDSPLETGYSYVESAHQTYLSAQYVNGTLDLSYIQRHPPVIFAAMPVFQQNAPYVLPSWFGLAIWATTPAFAYAFFVNVKRFIGVVIVGAAILALAAGFMLSRAIARAWETGWATADAPVDIHLAPFWLMTAVAVAAALYFRDRFTIACWAAIIPTVLLIFAFAFTGHAQFGYRYGLDFYPFLWLLVARTVENGMRWHHWVLFGASIAANLWGVLWIYQFEPHASFGVSPWVVF